MSVASESLRGRPSNSLVFTVGEMSGKLDHLIATLTPQLLDHDTRLSSVESFQWKIVGAGSILVFILGSWELIRYVILGQ